jgi:hypothetical protein
MKNKKLTIKTGVKAGALQSNHNATVRSGKKPLKIKSGVKAGLMGCGNPSNHNQTVRF